ncbi:MAG TPA: caspase family protein, partial [Polyangiaceae bacterium]
YTIAVGVNTVADELKRNNGALSTLRYADDDALKIYRFIGQAGRRAFLLSVLDPDTQRRFPGAAQHAKTPSLAELERTVDAVVRAMARDRTAGEEPELVFFFSGHGVRDDTGGASLSLLDGALTRSWLYERLLSRVPARVVHLVIDACHAAALVRPRDVNATLETLAESERQAYVDAATLERFPHVGAVLASSASAQSFEWDAYRGGVFAHQLLSGLRGGADVNGDGRLEYSEIAAFLSAANLRVRDARARLEVVVRPPRIDRRAPLFDLSTLKQGFELRGRAEGRWGHGFFVESESGERLVDVYPEQGARLSLHLPLGERLFVVRPDGEIELGARNGEPVALASLAASPPRARARGALDSALRDGLFAVRFGPAFYEGYVSQREELVPVPITPERAERRDAEGSSKASARASVGTALLLGGGAALVAGGVFTGLAIDAKNDYEATDLERSAEEASDRFHRYRTAAWLTGGTAVVLGAAGATLLLWPDGTGAGVAVLPEGGLTFGARTAF